MSDLKELYESLPRFRSEIDSEISSLFKRAESLQRACAQISQSSSGSWLSEYHDLYFGEFTIPSAEFAFSPLAAAHGAIAPGWNARTANEVKRVVEDLSSASLDEVETEGEQLIRRLEAMRETLLDAIHGIGDFHDERRLLESFDFDVSAERAEHTSALMPTEFGTIYQLSQGQRIPAHVSYDVTAHEAELRSKRAREFLGVSRKLERQLKVYLSASATEKAEKTDPDKAKRVFVVHGRDEKIRKAVFEFLRALELRPLEWEEAVALTGNACPYVGDVLEAAFKACQASVVLLSGDDEARLREALRRETEPEYETALTPQARPNVLFEAGMAFATHNHRTILVEFGQLRPFSDTWGRHAIRFDGSAEKRLTLRDRLQLAGCRVKDHGTDWLKAGDFASLELPSVSKEPKKSTTSAKAKKHVPSDLEILDSIYERYNEAFESYSKGSPTRATKIYVPIDIATISRDLDVDPDIVFGRLYYYLERKHGYKQEDGSSVHLFALAVGEDRHCINFPYAASILAALRDAKH